MLKARVVSLCFVCRHTLPPTAHRAAATSLQGAKWRLAQAVQLAPQASPPAPQANPTETRTIVANFLHYWVVSGPFCASAGKGDEPGFPIFLRPTTMGNKSEESECILGVISPGSGNFGACVRMCAHVCACVRMSDSVNSRSGIRLVWACLSLATRVANRALEGVGGLGGGGASACVDEGVWGCGVAEPSSRGRQSVVRRWPPMA